MRKAFIFVVLYISIGLLSGGNTSFADSLFARGEYYRAITEYYRSMHEGKDSDYCQRMICRAYLLGEDYQGLLDHLEENEQVSGVGYRAYALIKLDRADIAGVISRKGTEPVSGYWTAIALAYEGDHEEARQNLQTIPAPVRDQVYDPLSRVIDEASRQPRKSPLLAGALGIVPGLGYAYNGSWQTAISAFLTNALLLGITAELYDHDLKFTALGAGLASAGFYIGSIYGSAQNALRINKKHRVEYLDEALEPLIPDLLKLEE